MINSGYFKYDQVTFLNGTKWESQVGMLVLHDCQSNSNATDARVAESFWYGSEVWWWPHYYSRETEGSDRASLMEQSFEGKKFHVEIKATSWWGLGESCVRKSSDQIPYQP